MLRKFERGGRLGGWWGRCIGGNSHVPKSISQGSLKEGDCGGGKFDEVLVNAARRRGGPAASEVKCNSLAYQ